MSNAYPLDKKPPIAVKSQIAELEDKIFEKIALDYRLKDVLHPFAVLEKTEGRVLLGSTKEIAAKVNYNYLTECALRELVGAIVNDKHIEVKIKAAENEAEAVKRRIDERLNRQKEDKVALAEMEVQINEGRCNLIPFPKKDNKTRSDLVVERHSLFAANTFKGDFRSHERKIKDLETGETLTLRVEIGDQTGQVRGILKQKHQEAFYKLSQVWSRQNYQIDEDEKKNIKGSMSLSVYDLVQLLRGNDGGRNYKDVFRLLNEMATIRINIKKINKDGNCDVQNFTLLSYSWYAKGFNETTLRPNDRGESNVNICFSEFVTNQFLKKNIKSIMLDPYLSLKDQARTGLTQLLYTMLDYELSSKDDFHISLINLCSRLGLSTYEYKSARKRVFNISIKQLHGQPIINGRYKIDCNLAEAEDEKDWVLVAHRSQP